MIVESGVILLKCWLEVSPEEQTRRLKSRIDDGRKTWKLSPMDLKSYDRWDDYTKVRDAIFEATDVSWAPGFVARSEDKKRVRLNLISQMLGQVPYKEIKTKMVKLPPRKVGRHKAATGPPTILSATCLRESEHGMKSVRDALSRGGWRGEHSGIGRSCRA